MIQVVSAASHWGVLFLYFVELERVYELLRQGVLVIGTDTIQSCRWVVDRVAVMLYFLLIAQQLLLKIHWLVLTLRSQLLYRFQMLLMGVLKINVLVIINGSSLGFIDCEINQSILVYALKIILRVQMSSVFEVFFQGLQHSLRLSRLLGHGLFSFVSLRLIEINRLWILRAVSGLLVNADETLFISEHWVSSDLALACIFRYF